MASDEVVIPINGRKYWLWRAVDANGDVLDFLVQPQRNAKAALRFLKRLIARFGEPWVVVTDKLRSYLQAYPRACTKRGSSRTQGFEQPD